MWLETYPIASFRGRRIVQFGMIYFARRCMLMGLDNKNISQSPYKIFMRICKHAFSERVGVVFAQESHGPPRICVYHSPWKALQPGTLREGGSTTQPVPGEQ